MRIICNLPKESVSLPYSYMDMEKFITAAGCALRIRERGEGDSVIVLLHGYLASIEVWEGFIPLLSPPCRVVAIDLPGHGLSEVKGGVHTMEFLADVVRGVLERLKIGRCVLVGHSMGGYVALEFLRKYPEMLSGLVLLHSTPNPDSEAKKEQRQGEINLILAGKKEVLARTTPEKGFCRSNRLRMKRAIEELADQIMMTEDEGIVAVLRGMCERRDLNETMRQSAIPQLIILGRGDEYITPDIAEAMVVRQPQAQVVWLDHSGHTGFLEQPAETAQAILTFAAPEVSKSAKGDFSMEKTIVCTL